MTTWFGLMGLIKGLLVSSPALTRLSWLVFSWSTVKGMTLMAVKMARMGRRTEKTDLMGIPQSR